MNDVMTRTEPGVLYNLSEILNNPVEWNGKKIGKLSDLIIAGNGTVPEIICIVVKRPFGNPSLLVPWGKVKTLGGEKVVIDIDNPQEYQGEPKEDSLLLKEDILDKKILDLEDSEVEVVYDLQLALRNNKMYVTAVDSSRFGRWRRLGFRRTADSRQAADESMRT